MSTALKSLTFTTLRKPSVNPTLDRRSKIIGRLEEQKHCSRIPLTCTRYVCGRRAKQAKKP